MIKNNMIATIGLFLVFSFINSLTNPVYSQMSQKPEIPEEMDKIATFSGEWKNTATSFNPDGKVQFKEVFRSQAEPILGGRAISIRSSNKGEPAGASWFFYEPLKEKYVMVAIDTWGNYDEFSGNFEDGALVLTSEEREFTNGRKMIWRRTYTEFGKKRHVVKMHYSLDGGETWIYSNKQIEMKVSS